MTIETPPDPDDITLNAMLTIDDCQTEDSSDWNNISQDDLFLGEWEIQIEGSANLRAVMAGDPIMINPSV